MIPTIPETSWRRPEPKQRHEEGPMDGPGPATMPETALGGNLPDLDLNDPAQLEAFYGNFAFFDHYRKSILSQCHELLRAQYLEAESKVTEARLENEARIHPLYLDFLAAHFVGRHQRELNVLQSLRNGV